MPITHNILNLIKQSNIIWTSFKILTTKIILIKLLGVSYLLDTII